MSFRIPLRHNGSNLLLINAAIIHPTLGVAHSIDGMIVDTGSSALVLSPQVEENVVAAGFPPFTYVGDTESQGIGDEAVKAKSVRIPRIRIGNLFDLFDYFALIMPLGGEIKGLLGADVLHLMGRIAIDYSIHPFLEADRLPGIPVASSQPS